MSAAYQGNADAVRSLLDKGANVNEKDSAGRTALFVAAQEGHADITQLLIDNGAEINAKKGSGWTILMSAAFFNHADVVRILLDKGADVNSKDSEGGTVLSLSAQEGHADVVRLLLDKCADVNTRDNYGQTPLILASSQGHADIVRILLDKGADVNAGTDKGYTALIESAWPGFVDVMKILLEKGANIAAKDKEGTTALTVAARNLHEDAVRFLIEHGADVNAADKYGIKALMGAASAYINTKTNEIGTSQVQAVFNQDGNVTAIISRGGTRYGDDGQPGYYGVSGGKLNPGSGLAAPQEKAANALLAPMKEEPNAEKGVGIESYEGSRHRMVSLSGIPMYTNAELINKYLNEHVFDATKYPTRGAGGRHATWEDNYSDDSGKTGAVYKDQDRSPLGIPPPSGRYSHPGFGIQQIERQNHGAINPYDGTFYAPAGQGLVNTRDGTYYTPAGPNGYINTRDGQFVPAH